MQPGERGEVRRHINSIESVLETPCPWECEEGSMSARPSVCLSIDPQREIFRSQPETDHGHRSERNSWIGRRESEREGERSIIREGKGGSIGRRVSREIYPRIGEGRPSGKLCLQKVGGGHLVASSAVYYKLSTFEHAINFSLQTPRSLDPTSAKEILTAEFAFWCCPFSTT